MTETTKNEASRTQGRPAYSQLRRSWAKLRRNKAALFGGLLILIFVLTALLAPLLFPGSPSAPNLIKSLEHSSLEHPLNLLESGGDVLHVVQHPHRHRGIEEGVNEGHGIQVGGYIDIPSFSPQSVLGLTQHGFGVIQ